jgi:hypothetical protein
MSSILGLLTSALSLARELLYRLRRPRATPLQRAERAIHDARAASAQGDAAKVNGQAERAVRTLTQDRRLHDLPPHQRSSHVAVTKGPKPNQTKGEK